MTLDVVFDHSRIAVHMLHIDHIVLNAPDVPLGEVVKEGVRTAGSQA